ncbi:MAG TPA: lysine--tRNA ligase [archaeon]|nr:lysine--tRNA ligase [archaeon]HOZ35982.1 lysine--tRNA ligase [archaeon]
MGRLEEYQENRKNNFSSIVNMGIEPYPYTYDRTHVSKDIKEKYKDLEPDKYTTEIASVAGRVLSLRSLGKISFIDLHDTYGKMQIVVKNETTSPENLELLKKLDDGDIIGVKGKIFKTKRGELSIDAQDITFLSKAFMPLPEKFHGIQDAELKYRQRYLDLMTSKESRDIFFIRAKIIKIIREILDKKGFLEVETPLLQSLYGGANARPFITESFVWKRQLYLSISPELYLKRLLVGGFDKVYTICKNFRNEGIDRSHNPEFTMLECYEAFKDYNSAMDLIEEIYETIALELNGSTRVTYLEQTFDFKRPWKRLTMAGALKEYANLDVDKLSDSDLANLLKENRLELETYKRGLAISELFEHFCENHLLGPVHIIDHPKETTPLCKLHRSNKDLIERDEPYVNYSEAGNIYSELNDPMLQEKLMLDQADQGRGKGENHPVDTDFIESLKYGMPPAYGLGLGIDRLVMIFTNSANIREVILFPMMKEEGDGLEDNEKK